MILPIVVALLVVSQGVDVEAEARCVTDQLGAAERSEIARLAQENAEPPATLRTRLEEIGAGCAERRGWTPENAGNISGFAIATMIEEDTAPRLRRAGIDPALVDGWAAREMVQGRTSPPTDEAAAERLTSYLNEAGVPMPTLEANAYLLGAHAAVRTMIERVRRGLPVQ